MRLARTVARWRRLERSAELAHQHRSGSDEWWSDVRVGYARRIVHDLPTDASAQELAAVLDSLPDTAEAQRERAAAYMTVWDRLAAGEKLTDVAASVTPEPGAPAWRLPTDRDPVDRAARDLEPGDLVAGVYNTTFGGRRLVPSLVGPVAHVSDVRDRRESGTWLTVTLSSGDTAEMKSWQLVAVFPHAGAGGSQPVANLPPWRVLHQTADGRLAYVVHEGPTDGHPNGRVIRGEGGIRVEYVAPDGTQTGVFGWERPENLTARTEES